MRSYKVFVDGNIAECLVACDDLGNVVKTISQLPETFEALTTIVLTCNNFDHVARSCILLLIATNFEPATASTMMLHIWYSLLLPRSMLQQLRTVILPLIEDICAKVKFKPTALEDPDLLFSKVWTFAGCSIRLTLKQQHWNALLRYFEVPEFMTKDQARQTQLTGHTSANKVNERETRLFSMIPEWRICFSRFQEDGLLLPFEAPREQFDTPNP